MKWIVALSALVLAGCADARRAARHHAELSTRDMAVEAIQGSIQRYEYGTSLRGAAPSGATSRPAPKG